MVSGERTKTDLGISIRSMSAKNAESTIRSVARSESESSWAMASVMNFSNSKMGLSLSSRAERLPVRRTTPKNIPGHLDVFKFMERWSGNWQARDRAGDKFANKGDIRKANKLGNLPPPPESN